MDQQQRESREAPSQIAGRTESRESGERKYGIREIFRRKSGWFLAGVLLVWGGWFLLNALFLYIMPREYLGRVRMEILPQSTGFQVFPGSGALRSHDPETFMATQQMVITSKETLYKVIDQLQLVKKWEAAATMDEAFALLWNKVQVTGYPGTRLVDIFVLHTDPNEAAELANAIARAYRERRNSSENSRATAALDMLNAQENLQHQKVEDARIRMIELMEKFKIVDLAVTKPDQASPLADTPNTGTRALVIEAKMAAQKVRFEVANLKTRVNDILNRPPEILLAEGRGFFPERVLRQMDDYEKVRARLAVLGAQGISESAPEFVAARAERSFYEERLEAAVLDLKDSLKIRLEIAETQLNNLERIQDNYESQSMDERKRYAQYMEAKRDFETQGAILESMTRTLLEEKVNLTMPRDPTTIHEIAEANEVPARPDVEAGLWSGCLWGLAWSIPGGLGLMFLAYALSSGRNEEEDDSYEFEYVYESVGDEEPVEAIEVVPDPGLTGTTDSTDSTDPTDPANPSDSAGEKSPW